MSEVQAGGGQPAAAPDDGAQASGDTRRKFVERLAKTAALPLVVPLVLSMTSNLAAAT
jgi:hypothetical protein